MIKKHIEWGLISLVLFVLSGCVSGGNSMPNFTQAVEQQIDTVVQVFTDSVELIDDTTLQGSTGVGSGFIITNNGYIMTNSHVIESGGTIEVRLSDRRTYIATVVGYDEISDVAILKIDAEELPFVKMGDSESIKSGQWVFAVGHPFDLAYTVTVGIVSSTFRLMSSNRYTPFIQSDVAINPGNSGGPLFNIDGEVIGINSMIYSATGSYSGVSFAVPINTVRAIVVDLLSDGVVERGRIGIHVEAVTFKMSEAYGMKFTTGAFVSKVEPEGQADAGGMQVDDIIVKFNGVDITTNQMLPVVIGQSTVGTFVEVVVVRADGQLVTLSVEVGKLNSTNTEVLPTINW